MTMGDRITPTAGGVGGNTTVRDGDVAEISRTSPPGWDHQAGADTISVRGATDSVQQSVVGD